MNVVNSTVGNAHAFYQRAMHPPMFAGGAARKRFGAHVEVDIEIGKPVASGHTSIKRSVHSGTRT